LGCRSTDAFGRSSIKSIVTCFTMQQRYGHGRRADRLSRP
jgi:hypothetical protein